MAFEMTFQNKCFLVPVLKKKEIIKKRLRAPYDLNITKIPMAP